MAYKHTIFGAFASILLLLLSACDSESEPVTDKSEETWTPRDAQMTLFMYMPWSEGLTGYLHSNLDDMEKVIVANNYGDCRVIAFICNSSISAQMIELTPYGRITHKQYSAPDIATADGIASILHDMQDISPSPLYAMTIGCHGMGWLPAGSLNATPQTLVKSIKSATRYFGGLASQWQINVTTLANALELADIHLQYLLFDACYMGGVEVAYSLKDNTDVFVASPTEIINAGMPYNLIGNNLLQPQGVDWKEVCNKFLEFYKNYKLPFGILSAIDCRKLDHLAITVKEIMDSHTWDYENNSMLQQFGGYKDDVLFYDLGQYAETLAADSPSLISQFNNALSQTVIAKVNTDYYYTDYTGAHRVTQFSGLSTSAPSTSPYAADWNNTQWAQDTNSSK